MKLLFIFYKMTLNNAKFYSNKSKSDPDFPMFLPAFFSKCKKVLRYHRVKQNQFSILRRLFINSVISGKLSQHLETGLYKTWKTYTLSIWLSTRLNENVHKALNTGSLGYTGTKHFSFFYLP